MKRSTNLLGLLLATAALGLGACKRSDSPRAVAPGESSITASPGVVVADGAEVVTLTAVARGADGVPLAGRQAIFSVTGAANQLSATEARTGPDGKARVTLRSTRAEVKAASASIAGAAVGPVLVRFVAGPPSALTSTLSGPAGPVVADGVASGTVAVTVRDVHGNPVAGVPMAFASTGGTLSAASVTTGAAGTAAVSITSTVAGGVTVSVASGGIAFGAPVQIAFVPGPAAALAFTTSPSGATAGEIFDAPVRLEVEDALGNRVTSGGELVSLSLSGGAPGATLLGTLDAQAVGGEVAFADLAVDLAGSGYRLVASAPGLTEATSEPFGIVAGPVDPSTSFVTAAAPTSTAGVPVSVTATARDFFGNPVAGASIVFSATGEGAELVQPVAATGADGQASGTVSSSLAESKTIGARADGGAPFSGTAQVTFLPGAPSALASTLVASPAAVRADGETASTITATVKDAFGNAVPGASITFASSGAAAFTQPGPTGADGVTSGSVRSTIVGLQRVTARHGDLVLGGADVEFLCNDCDGDGVPDGEDSAPEDPAVFVDYAATLLDGVDGAFAAPVAINDGDEVAGFGAVLPSTPGAVLGARAVTWVVAGTAASAALRHEPLPGNDHSAAYGIAGSGLVVGESADGEETVAVYWTPGTATATRLPLGAFSPPAVALAVSGSWIVGEATEAGNRIAVLWEGTGADPVPLAPLAGGTTSAAYAISSAGVVVGQAEGGDGTLRAAAWRVDARDAPLPLHPLPGHVASLALGVNADGQIVGESEAPDGTVHAVRWTLDGGRDDLGAGSAAAVSRARIVGALGAEAAATIWDVRNVGLPAELAPGIAGETRAAAINASNVAVGQAGTRGFVAVPR